MRRRSRLILAVIVGVVVAGVVALFVESLSSPPAFLAGFGGALAFETIVGLVIGAIFFVGSALLGPTMKELSDAIGTKPCAKCTAGWVNCPLCSGSGTRPTEVDVQGDCPDCNASGKIQQQCPQCSGRRSITRPATFTPVGPTSAVKYEFKWKGTGHWQHVTVGVQNTDIMTASFNVSVAVPGSSTAGGSQALVLGPGGSSTVTFSFKIHGDVPYPVSSQVVPGTVQVQCPTCIGTGSVTVSCATCKGTGKIGRKEKRDAPCDHCGGKGRVVCETCKGTGRVQRVE